VAHGDVGSGFEALVARCPAPFREDLRHPPLRSPSEIASYEARLVVHAAAFGASIPARAWSPLRDLATAEIEADRYGAAIGGIVRHARAAALTDLLLEHAEEVAGRRRSPEEERACQALARAWLTGSREAQAEVAARLGRLGLPVSVIDDLAQARSLPMVSPLERMRSNAQRTAGRIRRLLEIIAATERDPAEDRAGQARPVPSPESHATSPHDAPPARRGPEPGSPAEAEAATDAVAPPTTPPTRAPHHRP
jgi:hypothetical protein